MWAFDFVAVRLVGLGEDGGQTGGDDRGATRQSRTRILRIDMGWASLK